MKAFSALVFTLAFVITGASALPSAAAFFNNFQTSTRRSLAIPPSRVQYVRSLGGLTFTADEASILRRQSSCGSACSSSADTTLLNNSLANATCALDTICVCNAVSQLTSACQTCVLASQGYTASSYQSACQAATSAIAVGTAVASAEEAVRSGQGPCVSQCGNETEIAGLDAIVGCGNNALCICSATNVTANSALTESCLSCLLQGAGTTVSGLRSICDAALATSASGAGSTSHGSVTPIASGATVTGATVTASGSASATSPSSSAAQTSAKSGAIKLERMYGVEMMCFALLASTFFFLA